VGDGAADVNDVMLRRRIALLVIGACAAVTAIPASSGASSRGLQDCGGSVRAGVVPCPKAKRIAKEYAKTRARSLQGFSCTSKRRDGQINARCVLNEKRVVFSFHA
jgi:hypothetical protein